MSGIGQWCCLLHTNAFDMTLKHIFSSNLRITYTFFLTKSRLLVYLKLLLLLDLNIIK